MTIVGEMRPNDHSLQRTRPRIATFDVASGGRRISRVDRRRGRMSFVAVIRSLILSCSLLTVAVVWII